MPDDKLLLLFGSAEPPEDVDLDDEGELIEHVRQSSAAALDDLQVALRAVIARQILDEEPALVWETARRLTSLGLNRDEVLAQLSRALAPIIESAIHGDDEDRDERYESLLRGLPLVTDDDVRIAVKARLATEGSTGLDDLLERVLDELYDRDLTQPVKEPVQDVIDQMLEDGELELLAGDIVVDPEALCAGIVQTTRAATASWPPSATDLAGLAFLTDAFGERPDVEEGRLLAVRWFPDKGLVIEPVDEPSPDEHLLSAVREAYETEHAEAGLPITFGELTLRLLLEDPLFFDRPRLPLAELVAAAGLQVRQGLIGGDAEVWRRLAHSRATFRIVDALDDEERADAAHHVYEVFERLDLGDAEAPVTASDLRHALDHLADDDVLTVVKDQLFGYDEDPESLDAAEVFARRLTTAASKPLQRAVAAVLTAMVEERRRNPQGAADALAAAVREAPDFFTAVDRLAWTRSDQGRGSEAKALWLRVDSADSADIEAIDAAIAHTQDRGAHLRRNDPCWCGSGRKYKVCHLRVTELPPLAERFPWMLRKTVSYLARRGAPLDSVIFNVAWALADGDPERFREVMTDPIVVDVVLHEHGWFARFLDERGALLPEDERELFQRWLPIRRTVYDIVGVRPGTGMTLRDLRTGDVTEVTEGAFSRTAKSGEQICARAVPDGHGHQLVGAVIGIEPGQGEQFLELLDGPSPVAVAEGLLDYVRSAEPRGAG